MSTFFQRTYPRLIVQMEVPYTRVNKRICLFSKLERNMRLIPNMRLIAMEKLTTPPNRDALIGSTHT